MKLGVTGADGFFGWHLRCRLATVGLPFVCANRATFARDYLLDEFVAAADVIVHLAGVNRAPNSEEIRVGNVNMAKALAASIGRLNVKADVVYANSTKAVESGPYGESKAEAASILAAAVKRGGGRFADILFPHLYGEFGTPYYNSAVTTFAHQLVRGETSAVNEGQLELLHVQDACQLVVELVTGGSLTWTQYRPAGRKTSVTDAYLLMERLAGYATTGTIPEIADDDFELRLFNVIRSQMWPDFYPFSLTRHVDHRGSFFEVVRAWGQGQTSISTTVPGVTRGEHYHLNKVERFAVVSGDAVIRVRKLFSQDLVSFRVRGEEPCFVDMPPLCTHNITNVGSRDLVTLFWSHDHFAPEYADTWPLPVVGNDLAA